MLDENLRYKSLDFIKGISIIMIILVHYNQSYNPDFIFLRYFQMACPTLFVASGFCIANLISNKYKDINNKQTRIKFYLSRIKTIYPLWIIALIMNYLLNGLMWLIPTYKNIFPVSSSVVDILCSVFLINGLVPNRQFPAVQGGWYIGTTIILYLITPYIIGLFNKHKKNKNSLFILISIISISMLFILNKLIGLEFYLNNSFGYYLVFDHMPAYLLGILLFINISEENEFNIVKTIIRFICFVVALYASYYIYFHPFFSNYNVSLWLMAIASYFILYVLIVAEKTFKIVSFNKYLQKLGRNSYVVYIFHFYFVKNLVYLIRFLMSFINIDTNNRLWFYGFLPVIACCMYSVANIYEKSRKKIYQVNFDNAIIEM